MKVHLVSLALSLSLGLVLVELGTAQGDQDDEALRAPAPTTAVPRDQCSTADCHGPVHAGERIHGPLFVDACDVCHELADAAAHAYRTPRDERALCTHCHELGGQDHARVHAPVGEGDCLSCHDPHAGFTQGILREPSALGMCGRCHADLTAGGLSAHAPAVEGACDACHEPHGSRHAGILVREGQTLCLECHDDVRAEVETRSVGHSPVQEDCTLCHDPHASGLGSLLTGEVVDLCTGCHEEVRHEALGGTHEAVTLGRGCLNCHDPHASDHPALLADPPVALCLDCHEEEVRGLEGEVVGAMGEVLQERLVLHGPVATGDCTACHGIHGSDLPSLLTETFEEGLYQELEDDPYSLCFSCHDRDLVHLERSTAVTGFRNGDLNLHAVHVGRERKSRSCSTCHDPHGADNQHHLRDSLPFGPQDWELEIAWRGTPTGGSCASGCHLPFAYDREDPVTYPVLPMGEQDWSGGRYKPPEEPEPAPEPEPEPEPAPPTDGPPPSGTSTAPGAE